MNRVLDKAERLNKQGNELYDAGEVEKAEQAYLAASQADPSWSNPLFNLGMLYKHMGRFEQSLQRCLQAVELNPQDEGAWWNLGIAATALGDWGLARKAWVEFGVELPPGDGPPEMNLGMTPIRLKQNDEVVWCSRIDPARAIIRSVPLAQSEHRFGDLVLHDGSPNGYREFNGQQVAVFDQLCLLSPSGYSTWEIELRVEGQQDLHNLAQQLLDKDCGYEDWTQSVRMLCKECSEGIAHDHEDPPEQTWSNQRILGLASRTEKVLVHILDAWCEASKLRQIHKRVLVLDAQAASPLVRPLQ